MKRRTAEEMVLAQFAKARDYEDRCTASMNLLKESKLMLYVVKLQLGYRRAVVQGYGLLNAVCSAFAWTEISGCTDHTVISSALPELLVYRLILFVPARCCCVRSIHMKYYVLQEAFALT